MEKRQYSVGERVEKLCTVCGEERGHIVASVSKRGQVTRVSCPQCGTRSPFKSGGTTKELAAPQESAPYNRARTYRKGQMMLHPTFGPGEVTAVVDAQKIDVLFSDRLRRLVHASVLA